MSSSSCKNSLVNDKMPPTLKKKKNWAEDVNRIRMSTTDIVDPIRNRFHQRHRNDVSPIRVTLDVLLNLNELNLKILS